MNCHISEAQLGETGFSYTLSLISGKYKMTILYALMEFGVVRFNELQRYIGTISYKTLSSTLKQLEAWSTASRGADTPSCRCSTSCASGASGTAGSRGARALTPKTVLARAADRPYAAGNARSRERSAP